MRELWRTSTADHESLVDGEDAKPRVRTLSCAPVRIVAGRAVFAAEAA
jgi:hypothetical protein